MHCDWYSGCHPPLCILFVCFLIVVFCFIVYCVFVSKAFKIKYVYIEKENIFFNLCLPQAVYMRNLKVSKSSGCADWLKLLWSQTIHPTLPGTCTSKSQLSYFVIVNSEINALSTRTRICSNKAFFVLLFIKSLSLFTYPACLPCVCAFGSSPCLKIVTRCVFTAI